MIGVGVTTYGDRKCLEYCIRNIKSFTPVDKIIVIKDIKGISGAKNKCLSELDHCEHIFLFDDDTRPIRLDWHLEYIQSGHLHLSYTFNRNVIGMDEKCYFYEKPSGCMLYINRRCLEVVGGFDEQYHGYAGEHQDFSNRVYNNGLTISPYIDLKHSSTIIHSMDEHMEVISSLTPQERAKFIPGNMRRLKQNMNSKEFKPYK